METCALSRTAQLEKRTSVPKKTTLLCLISFKKQVHQSLHSECPISFCRDQQIMSYFYTNFHCSFYYTFFPRLMSELANLAQQHMAQTAPRVQDGWDDDVDGAALSVPSTILVVIGRVCLALPNVCPQMQMCASAASLANPDVARVRQYQKICLTPYNTEKRSILDTFSQDSIASPKFTSF